MSYKKHIDDNLKFVAAVWEGDVYYDEIIQMVSEHQAQTQITPKYESYNEILDLSEAGSIQLTPSDLRNIAKIASETDYVFPERKFALIVRPGLAYSIAVLYTAIRGLLKHSTKTIKAFHSMEEAVDWVT